MQVYDGQMRNGEGRGGDGVFYRLWTTATVYANMPNASTSRNCEGELARLTKRVHDMTDLCVYVRVCVCGGEFIYLQV